MFFFSVLPVIYVLVLLSKNNLLYEDKTAKLGIFQVRSLLLYLTS